MNRIIISSKLIRIAKIMITASIISKFEESMKKKNPDIDENKLKEMSKFIESCNNNTKIKNLAVYLLLNNFLDFPDNKDEFDIISQIFENFRNLDYNEIKSKKDYDKFIHPEKYMDEDENCKKYFRSLNKKSLKTQRNNNSFNPDVEFRGRKYKSGDVTIYTLEETKQEMQKVRKALDIAYGTDRNPWCLATRTDNNDISFEPDSENFEESWKMWEHYNKSPKRIAFQNNNPVAFYADDRWWDLDDNHHDDFPISGIIDDKEFLDEREKYCGLVEKLRSGGYLTENEMRTLAEDRNQYVRKSVARKNDLPYDIMKTLAKDKHDNVRYAISRRNDLPYNIMKIIAKDKNDDIRSNIAKKDDLPDDLMKMLAEDKYWYIRALIAKKDDLPDDLMKMLAEDHKWSIRAETACRKILPYNIMKILSEDRNAEVRKAIAERNDLPESIMKILSEDKDELIRRIISEKN